VSAAAACVRDPAAACCLPLSFIYLFIHYLLYGVCSGNMRQASCWSCHFLSFHSTFFSACSSSMLEASCGSMMPAIIIIYLFTIHL
jgi:hypothetical protein